MTSCRRRDGGTAKVTDVATQSLDEIGASTSVVLFSGLFS